MFTKNHTASADICSREELTYHLQEQRYFLNHFYASLEEAMHNLKKSEYHAALAKEAKRNLTFEDV